MAKSSALRQQVQNQMYSEPEDSAPASKKQIFARTASTDEITSFYRSFSILMKSGYTVNRALNVLSETVSNEDLAKTLANINVQIEKGQQVSQAMSAYPWYFDAVSIGVFRAAEETARLSEALEFLAETAELGQDVRQRVTESISYPAFVGIVSILMINAILYFVAPEFSRYIQDAGIEITGLSKFVFALSDLVRMPIVPPVVFLSIALGIWSVLTWSRRNPMSFYRTLGRIPLLGSIMLKGSLVRFVSMFHMMNANGVSVAKSLKMAESTVHNEVLRKAIGDMHASVERGQSMTAPLKNYPFPVRFIDMLRLGEQTGQFETILPNLTRSLTQELHRTTSRVTMASEPVMLLVLGGVVLVILLSFFMPYFDVIGSLSVGA